MKTVQVAYLSNWVPTDVYREVDNVAVYDSVIRLTGAKEDIIIPLSAIQTVRIVEADTHKE